MEFNTQVIICTIGLFKVLLIFLIYKVILICIQRSYKIFCLKKNASSDYTASSNCFISVSSYKFFFSQFSLLIISFPSFLAARCVNCSETLIFTTRTLLQRSLLFKPNDNLILIHKQCLTLLIISSFKTLVLFDLDFLKLKNN